MRKNIVFFLIIFVFVVVTPLFVCTTETPQNEETFVVYNTVTQKTEKVSVDDYIIREVCAKISPATHAQAIKAQIVVTFTNALRETQLSQMPYNFSWDFPETKDKDFYNLVKTLLKDVKSQTLNFENQLALCAYHKMSNGKTNTAQSVWGEDVPYLTSVESEGDLLAGERSYSLGLTKEMVLEKLKLTSETDEVTVDYNEFGYAKSVTLFGSDISAEEFRKLFEIKSSTFTIELISENLIISGVGDGHGVGMSLYGADFLARQGYDYTQILSHYYPNCQIKKDGI